MGNMTREIQEFVIAVFGVGGIVGLMAFIPWTKMALGAALTFLGAFYPALRSTPRGGPVC